MKPMEQHTELQWKAVRGRKGMFWSPVGRGSLIKDTTRQTWFFSVGRGDGKRGADRWGPLEVPLENEAEAVKAATMLERQLDRAGWFALKCKDDAGWSGAEMDACLGKMPRRVTPYYFLISFDKKQAAIGKSRKGDVLHVGGIDIHRRESNWVDAGMYPDTEATLVFTPPGQKPLRSNSDAFRLKMDGHEFDALIAHLLEIRAGLATESASQASAQEIGRVNPGDFDSPEGLRSRFQRMQQKSASINGMFTRLFSLSPANLSTLFMILETMERGDRITGLRVEADNGSPDATVEMLASSDSVTAATLTVEAFAVDSPAGVVH